MTITPLTDYEWERNRVEQTGRYQHHSEFPNDNQTTYLLWIREKQGGTDRQRSVLFYVSSPMTIRPLTSYEWESNRVEQTSRDEHYSEFLNHSQTTYSLWMRATGWNRETEISTILNSPMTIRPLTCYKWESNRVEQTGRDQHYSKFSNDNQTTYRLKMRES